MIDKGTSIQNFFMDDRHAIDRWIFSVISIVCALGALSLLLGTNFLMLREFANTGKALVFLLFTPALIFLMWFCLVLLPFSEKKFSRVLRVALYIVFFLLFNF